MPILKFDELSLAQRRWVELARLVQPQLKSSITLREIKDIHQVLFDMRKVDMKFKIGFPTWLITHNVIKRGVYYLPDEFVDQQPSNINPELEPYYQTALVDFGLK